MTAIFVAALIAWALSPFAVGAALIFGDRRRARAAERDVVREAERILEGQR